MRMNALTIAAVAVLTGLTPAEQISISAQGAQQQRTEGIDRTWKNAGGIKTVLYNWANHMGRLRGIEGHDLIATLEFVATGTVTVNGQPCAVTRYRTEINYQQSGMRADFACTLPNGQSHEEIQVVGGQYAWNEVGGPGAGLVPGQGTAVPMMAAHAERAIRLWSNPQGALKSAVTGGGGGLCSPFSIASISSSAMSCTLTSSSRPFSFTPSSIIT